MYRFDEIKSKCHQKKLYKNYFKRLIFRISTQKSNDTHTQCRIFACLALYAYANNKVVVYNLRNKKIDSFRDKFRIGLNLMWCLGFTCMCRPRQTNSHNKLTKRKIYQPESRPVRYIPYDSYWMTCMIQRVKQYKFPRNFFFFANEQQIEIIFARMNGVAVASQKWYWLVKPLISSRFTRQNILRCWSFEERTEKIY